MKKTSMQLPCLVHGSVRVKSYDVSKIWSVYPTMLIAQLMYRYAGSYHGRWYRRRWELASRMGTGSRARESRMYCMAVLKDISGLFDRRLCRRA